MRFFCVNNCNQVLCSCIVYMWSYRQHMKPNTKANLDLNRTKATWPPTWMTVNTISSFNWTVSYQLKSHCFCPVTTDLDSSVNAMAGHIWYVKNPIRLSFHCIGLIHSRETTKNTKELKNTIWTPKIAWQRACSPTITQCAYDTKQHNCTAKTQRQRHGKRGHLVCLLCHFRVGRLLFRTL